jgi:hypothetical protein
LTPSRCIAPLDRLDAKAFGNLEQSGPIRSEFIRQLGNRYQIEFCHLRFNLHVRLT